MCVYCGRPYTALDRTHFKRTLMYIILTLIRQYLAKAVLDLRQP